MERTWFCDTARTMKISLLSGAILLTTLAVSSVPAHARIITQLVDYKEGDTTLQGYLAYDNLFKGKRPGVLVAHQWKGLGNYEESRARMLAQMGYVAFALDLYGKGVRPKDAKEAGTLAGTFKADRPLWRRRAQAALETLRAQSNVDAKKLAIIGYCLGGGTALELARSGADLRGFVSFHGSLDTPTPADAKNIKGEVLVLHGAIDPFSPPEQVEALRKELSDAKVPFEINLYGGAVHSFTERDAGNDISKGAAYNEKADRRSWQAMRNFFTEIFGGNSSQ